VCPRGKADLRSQRNWASGGKNEPSVTRASLQRLKGKKKRNDLPSTANRRGNVQGHASSKLGYGSNSTQRPTSGNSITSLERGILGYGLPGTTRKGGTRQFDNSSHLEEGHAVLKSLSHQEIISGGRCKEGGHHTTGKEKAAACHKMDSFFKSKALSPLLLHTGKGKGRMRGLEKLSPR